MTCLMLRDGVRCGGATCSSIGLCAYHWSLNVHATSDDELTLLYDATFFVVSWLRFLKVTVVASFETALGIFVFSGLSPWARHVNLHVAVTDWDRVQAGVLDLSPFEARGLVLRSFVGGFSVRRKSDDDCVEPALVGCYAASVSDVWVQSPLWEAPFGPGTLAVRAHPPLDELYEGWNRVWRWTLGDPHVVFAISPWQMRQCRIRTDCAAVREESILNVVNLHPPEAALVAPGALDLGSPLTLGALQSCLVTRGYRCEIFNEPSLFDRDGLLHRLLPFIDILQPGTISINHVVIPECQVPRTVLTLFRDGQIAATLWFYWVQVTSGDHPANIKHRFGTCIETASEMVAQRIAAECGCTHFAPESLLYVDMLFASPNFPKVASELLEACVYLARVACSTRTWVVLEPMNESLQYMYMQWILLVRDPSIAPYASMRHLRRLSSLRDNLMLYVEVAPTETIDFFRAHPLFLYPLDRTPPVKQLSKTRVKPPEESLRESFVAVFEDASDAFKKSVKAACSFTGCDATKLTDCTGKVVAMRVAYCLFLQHNTSVRFNSLNAASTERFLERQWRIAVGSIRVLLDGMSYRSFISNPENCLPGVLETLRRRFLFHIPVCQDRVAKHFKTFKGL